MDIKINEDFSWSLTSLGNVIKSCLHQFNRITTVVILDNVIRFLESCHFCSGNEDKKYFPIQAKRKGLFKDSSGTN